MTIDPFPDSPSDPWAAFAQAFRDAARLDEAVLLRLADGSTVEGVPVRADEKWLTLRSREPLASEGHESAAVVAAEAVTVVKARFGLIDGQ
jgi:hypothetical protein